MMGNKKPSGKLIKKKKIRQPKRRKNRVVKNKWFNSLKIQTFK
jgi:hypothetical protein